MGAPTAAKKKAPAKRAPAKAAAVEEPTDAELEAGAEEDDDLAPGEIRPVIIGKRGLEPGVKVEMVTIFELDGVPYQVPRNPSAALVLSYLLDVPRLGMDMASMTVGMEMLGEAPLQALKASPQVKPEDLGQILENIGIVFFTSDTYAKVMAAPNPS